MCVSNRIYTFNLLGGLMAVMVGLVVVFVVVLVLVVMEVLVAATPMMRMLRAVVTARMVLLPMVALLMK